MADLTDDDLESWLQTNIDPQLLSALTELKRRRGERATSADRVRTVVRDAVGQAFNAFDHGFNADRGEIAEHAAHRAASQLTLPPGSGDAELRGFQLLRRHLDEGGHDWRKGTAAKDVQAACALLDRLIRESK
jgi:hypothetical protein